MPPVTNLSSVTGLPVPDWYIHTTDARFVDTNGRTLLLRGVNLSGSSKTPVGCPSQDLTGFWETAEAGGESFIGRPLNLDDGSADVHLARLRGWGFNMLRYVVTWESLEHQGPEKYDYDFMDYTVRVLRRCKDFGFRVYLDPHQDLWSRFSGGSGAPYWTLAACGFEPRNFSVTEATLIHCEYPNPNNPDPASFPAMIWSTNYFRLACQTLFTLFFAGRDFAPKCIIDGMNIQDYLTTHYLNAFRKLAERIRDAGDLYGECVIGLESLNEPSEGYLGHENLNDYSSEQAMKRGTRPTPAQSMRLGMGVAQTVQNWSFGSTGPKREGWVTVDPKGVKAWMDPSHEPNCVNSRWGWKRSKGWKLGTCIWALHDVWDPESGYILIPDYFHSPPFDPTRRIDFVADYWRPHWRLWSQMLRDVYPECIHFIQPPVFVKPPRLEEEDLHGRCCYTPHYYDGLTLVTRHWNWFNADALGLLRGKYKTTLQALRIGEWAIRRSLQDQLGMFLEDAKESLGAFPTLISEIGTPFDMDEKRAYQDGPHFGDYTEQQKALDASLNGADGTNCLNWTVWSYCPDNNHNWGDGYNLEDLSMWSADDLVFRGGIEGMDHRIGENLASVRQSINDQSNTRLLLTGNLSSSSLTNELSDLPPVVPPITPFTPFHLGNPSSSTVETFDEAQPPRSTGGYPLRNLPADDSSSIASTTSVYDCGAEADNLYDFLTNGARAVGAFCRPWPIAVVGVPKDIQFNISKADFKLVVSVTDADVAAASKHRVSPSSSARSRSLSEDTEKEAMLPTEIYLPLVHYSADPFTKRLKPLSPFRDPSAPNLPGLQLIRPSVESRTSADPSSTAYSSSGSGTPTPAGGKSPLGDALATMVVEGHGNSQAPVWATWAGRDCPLALVVEASEGSRWEVDGQVLKWWYPVTAPAVGEKSVDSAQEHWIRVRRAQGPIKGIGSAEIYLDEEGTSWWDACCPKWM